MNEIETSLYDFIREEFDIGDDPEYTSEADLFGGGFVDSLDAFTILTFCEEKWGIEITQRDLTLFPMNTVREIASVVAGKL